MLEKCVLTIPELNWNQRLGYKKTKLNISHHMLTSSTQLQNRSFHVVERTKTSSKCQKMKNARAKRAKILFFIFKYANLWGFCCRRHGLLKLSTISTDTVIKKALASTTGTVIKTQQIKTLIGRVTNNKRAARAASTLGQFRAVLVNNNVKLPHFQFC